MTEQGAPRFAPLSDNEEIFAVVIHSLDRRQSEADLAAWLKRASRLDPEDIVQRSLGTDLIQALYNTADPMSVVLRAHLYFESFIDALLARRFKRPDIILRNRSFTFAMKLDLLRAASQADSKTLHDIKGINELRNRFAHNVRFSLADFDMSTFTYCSELKQVIARLQTTEAKTLVNVYIFKLVSYFLLLRLTTRYPFIADLR